MPVSKYYGGHGEKVMRNMKKQYGEKKGKQVFYATANKRKGASPSNGVVDEMTHKMSHKR